MRHLKETARHILSTAYFIMILSALVGVTATGANLLF